MIEIKGGKRQDNKKGPWLVIEYVNDKGEEKSTNIFDQKVIDQYVGPGKYEATWVQKGKYWNLSGLEAVSVTENQKTEAPAASPKTETVPASGNRLTVAIACVEAAGRLAASTEAPLSEKADLAVALANSFMCKCESFITGKVG